MKHIFAIVDFLLLLAPNASAALLSEVRNESGSQPFLEMSFALNRPGPLAGFSVWQHPRKLVGPLVATADERAAMTPYLMDGSTPFDLYLNGVTRFFVVYDLYRNGTVPGNPGTALFASYAPQLGSGFTGYRITEVTQEAVAISSETLQQVLRIYGEPVPEPVTLVLVVVAVAAFTFTRKRGR